MRKEKAQIFNDTTFQIEIFRLLENISKDKGIASITEWAEKADMNQSDLSKILSAKKGLTQDKFEKIISAIGISEKQLLEIEKEARENIYRRKYGENLNIIPKGNENFNILEDLELDSDLVKSFSLSMKGQNRDALKEDLKKTIDFLVNTKYK